MTTLKVLVADDSVVYRSQIRAALAGIPGIEVVAVAPNGKLALDRLGQSAIDLLTLDLEMPVLDGLQTLAAMKERGLATKVLVFSSQSKRGAEITMEALRLGAADFVPKPGGAGGDSPLAGGAHPTETIRALLVPKIQALFPRAGGAGAPAAGPAPRAAAPPPSAGAQTAPAAYPKIIWDLFQPQIIVIGSSTGGPTALEKIFAEMKGPYRCPIVITQHMPPLFTAALADRLGKLAGVRAKEAQHGETPEANTIYLAPGDYHLRIKATAGAVNFSLDKGPLVQSVRPAVDPLFATATEVYRNKVLGIVLTGMGADGRDGAIAVKNAGGAILIQEKESCVVYGMPRAVQESGAYDRIVALEEIARLIGTKAQAYFPAAKKGAS